MDNLGLADNDRDMLTSDLSIIVNCAASIEFNYRLD